MLSRILEQVEHFRGGDDDILGSGYAEDSTDVYSSQFETILDNTSLYYSAESLETLYSEPDSYFSFEMPLTPMIQQRIKEGGQFLERTSAGGQQDVLSISADGGIVMGCSSGIANGLSGSSINAAKMRLQCTGVRLNLKDRVWGEVGRKSLIALPGRGSHRELVV